MSDQPRYELLDEIGQGPSATVWRARDLSVGRQVAVKALHEAPGGDEARRQLLEAQAELASLGEDEHRVRVLDIDRDRAWLVVEHLPGSLARRLADGPLAADEVRGVLRQALAGLAGLHAAGRLHGAVKPSNLLLTEGGQVKLADARGLDPAAGGEWLRPVGLPRYLAPEFIDPAFGPVGPAADLYALGAVALELLAGPGFDALAGVGPDAPDPEIAWLRLHGSPDDRLPPAASIAPGLPADLAAVIDRLLAKEVAGRYAGAAEVLADLGPAPAEAAEPPISPEPPRPAPPAAPKPWKNPWVVYPAVAGLLALAVGLTLLRPRGQEPVEQAPQEFAVSVASNPAGARVAVDGQDRGRTPLRLALAPGAHQVKLSLPGWLPLERKLTVEKAGEHTFSLEPRGVRVESTPPGARLSIDGRERGVTPLRAALKPGKYALKLTRAGCLPLAETLVVSADASGPRKYTLVLLADLAKQRLQAAQGHMDRERWALALPELKKAVELDEAQPLAHAWLAHVHDALGNAVEKKAAAERAGVAAERALQANANDAEALLARGLARMWLRQLGAAVADLSRAVSLSARPARAYQARALVHQARWDATAALADANEALAREPQLLPALRLRGDLWLVKNQPARAGADFTAALAVEKELASAWAGRGRVRHLQQDLRGAIVDFTESLRLSPGVGLVEWRRAEVYVDLGDRYESRGEKEDPRQALDWYQRAADAGHPRGQYAVGMACWEGRGLKADPAQAVAWFRKAAAQDHAGAQNQLGVAHLRGQGAAQDDAQAVAWFRKAAQQGFAAGQRNLAWAYEEGRGAARDLGQARQWYLKAAGQKDAFAQGRLGWMAENGLETKQDLAEALKWYQQAAAGGDVESMNHLGRFFKTGAGVKQSDAEAVKWFLAAAKEGLPKAQYNLAVMLALGRGAEKNEAEAAGLFLLAAQAGLPAAQARIGLRYADGRAVKRDEAQAVFWLKKAAGQKDARAQNALGWLAEHGTKPNLEEAAGWYRLAAEQNLPQGQFNLARMYAQGAGVLLDAATALKWYGLAANQGLPEALNALGRLHALGRGVPRNDAEAVKLYRLAAEKTHPEALNNLGWMLVQGRGVGRNNEEAVKLFRRSAALKQPFALNNLAGMFILGRGVERNAEEAARLYRQAAEMGLAEAQENLGVLYENGWGVKQDRAEAEGWFARAKANKNKFVMHTLLLPRRGE